MNFHMDIAFNIKKNRVSGQCFKIDFQRNRMGSISLNPDETVVFVEQDGLQAAVVIRDLHQVVVDYSRLNSFQDFPKMNFIL